MGRAPCCDKANVKKGPWSPEEDAKLKEYIHKNGTGGNWIALPHKVGLRRCGKSCRLRWLNYLRPNIKHGEFSDEEDRIICTLYATIGSRWSIIAGQLPGRTDNDIKNYWNTKLKKKLMGLTTPAQYPKRPNPQALYPLPSPTPFHHAPYSYEPPLYPSPTAVISPNYPSNLLTFGGECSSSDGSCITNQIDPSFSHPGYFSNFTGENLGCIAPSPQDYYSSIEEIKELISSSNSSFNYFMDEVRTEEQVFDVDC